MTELGLVIGFTQLQCNDLFVHGLPQQILIEDPGHAETGVDRAGATPTLQSLQPPGEDAQRSN